MFLFGEERKLVSIPRDKILTVATNRSVPAGTFQREGPHGMMQRKMRAHIGILCVNSSSRHNPSLLLILIESQRVSIEATLNDVESSLVGDTVAVTKGRWTGVVCAGHIMDRDEVG
jgi:hypothetical protein